VKILIGACALLALAFAPASAQQWPEKPVHLVVPFAPGGNIDIAARIIGVRLAEILGQNFVVENRPGGGGLVAGEYVARSAPDGYTVFVGANGPLLFSPIVTGRPVFEWRRDFAVVGSVSFTPMVLQVHPSIPANTIGDLIALSKQRELFMGLGGAGSTNHLVSELLQETTGARWTSVMYRGNAPSMNAVVSGEVNFTFEQVSVVVPFIRDGKLRALAVTSLSRVPQLPEVPTFAEQGFKDFEASTFTGLFVPAQTPKPVIARLNEALAKVLQEKDTIDRFEKMGAEVRASTPEAFLTYVQKVEDTWLPVIKRLNIKAD